MHFFHFSIHNQDGSWDGWVIRIHLSYFQATQHLAQRLVCDLVDSFRTNEALLSNFWLQMTLTGAFKHITSHMTTAAVEDTSWRAQDIVKDTSKPRMAASEVAFRQPVPPKDVCEQPNDERKQHEFVARMLKTERDDV